MRRCCRLMNFDGGAGESRGDEDRSQLQLSASQRGQYRSAACRFLHRNLQDSERDKQRTVPGSTATPNSLVSKDQMPVIEVDVADFGLRIYTIRKPGDGRQYLRVTDDIYPNLAAFNGSTTGEGYSAHCMCRSTISFRTGNTLFSSAASAR